MCSKQSWEIDTDMNVGASSCEWGEPPPWFERESGGVYQQENK